MVIKGMFKQISTVTRHKIEVAKLCFKCGLTKQGLLHDLSKYSPSELLISAKYYSGKHSPTENEIRDKGYSSVWLHHKGRNKHHFEYWQDYTHDATPICMPPEYIVEMFCDRVAACKIYQKDKYTDSSALDYFNSKPNEPDMMHPDTCGALLQLLTLLSKWGEDKTCKYIKEEWLPARK